MNGKKYYIEIFGIIGNEKYEIRKNEKIQLCKDNNIPLITFDFNDFWSNTNEQIYELLLHKIQEDTNKRGNMFRSIKI
jgi:predicted adenine nucleotide alpha hydrolase (AANH) superfamily ATPase